MNSEKTIRVERLTRVEGHGTIHIRIKDGKVEECQWQVVEAPRFFEAMLRGRKWDEVAWIMSRICGICSIGHTVVSLKATEAAMRVSVSKQTQILRKLLLHGENMQSHMLHVGYLVLPDLLGVPSVIPLASTHREQLLLVVRLHRLANEMSALLGGRTTHPQRLVVGGFAKWPTLDEMEALRQKLDASLKDAEDLAHLFEGLVSRFPPFQRETEYIALVGSNEYAIYDGDIASTDGGRWPVARYKEISNEYMVPHSTAKFARHNRDSYMVGALARLNINYYRLSPRARKVADLFGLRPVNCNPFMNSIAQIVEVVHAIEDSCRLIDAALKGWIREGEPKVYARAGKGASAVEVPRGILFHEYEYDGDGVCTWANCVIPTNQNHANIQKDMEALVFQIKDLRQEEIEHTVQMLVRAYDPCISCSTH